MTVFLIESVILGVHWRLPAGPFVGVYFTKLLGASSGFLEFVQRASLEVVLNSTVVQNRGRRHRRLHRAHSYPGFAGDAGNDRGA